MKRKNQRIKLTFALVATLTFMLTSCSLYYGLKQTDPNRKAPGVIERWWTEQHAHQNSR